MKIIKKALLSVVVVSLVLSVCSFAVSAATVSVTGGNYVPGQNVSVTVGFDAGVAIYTADISVTYDAAVLKLNSVSGADYSGGNGSIKILDDNLSTATENVTSGSYTINFTAVADGTSNISVSAYGVDAALAKHSASSSAAVVVATPAPSSNANLASLRVSGAALSPAFSASVTNYTATVRFDITKATVSAGVADGGATCVGAGTFDLQVGDNARTITVTAADGTRKSYTVVVKRLSQEETAALDEQERQNDPLLVVIDGIDYHIKNDFSDMTLPAGFSAVTTLYKDGEVAAITDEAAKYTFCYLVADDGSVADWFAVGEDGTFSRLAYILFLNKMYIFENWDETLLIPDDYEAGVMETSLGAVKAIKSKWSSLKDFYIIHCYCDGETAFYRYDSLEGVIQRAPDFALLTAEQVSELEKSESIFSNFAEMNPSGKAIIILVVISAAIIMALVVLLIIKLVSSAKQPVEFVPIGRLENSADEFEEVQFDQVLEQDATPDLNLYEVTETGEVQQVQPQTTANSDNEE